MTITGGGLELSVNPADGRWTGLTGGRSSRSWLAGDSDCGLPFVGGSGSDNGHAVILPCRADGNGITGTSIHGESHLELSGNDDALTAVLTLPDRRGPRCGLLLDLDHLDRESLGEDGSDGAGRNITDTLMPVAMDTVADLNWGWVAWHRADDELLLVVVDGPSAGWHTRYSYAGHRMEGFQVLARADDVLADKALASGGRLPSVTSLRVHLALVGSRREAEERAAALLDLAQAWPGSSVAVLGSSVAVNGVNGATEAVALSPSGTRHAVLNLPGEVHLDEAGLWTIRCERNGRRHDSGVYALDDWKALARRSIDFHRSHYQLERGAFARALNTQLKPDGRNFGRDHFGNPDELQSCRTGEFGGFGAWAQLRHQNAFGVEEELHDSVDRYFGWLFNRGREDDPGPNTICFTPQEAHGRQYSAYHFFNEICYAQHEVWLIGQLAEAVASGHHRQGEYHRHLLGLIRHYLSDHVGDDGIIWNQNWPDEKPVDYSTVDCPLIHLLAAREPVRAADAALGAQLDRICRLQAEHLYRRGFDFPTEGEACTEDGSIACQAWGLARAANELSDPDPRWIELASQLMAYHSKLELSGPDARVHSSSLRFWETMYETEAYGPSINAGHGWTIWSAWARWELYRATGSYAHLAACWAHCGCVAAKLEPDGSFPCCFTPDPVPCIPHDDAWGRPYEKHEGRTSSALAALGPAPGRSMSSMHLFLLAPQAWYDPEQSSCINARIAADGSLVPHGPLPCTRLALASWPRKALTITGLSQDTAIRISCDTGAPDGQTRWQFSSSDGTIRVGGTPRAIT